jgi:hypothetical protein
MFGTMRSCQILFIYIGTVRPCQIYIYIYKRGMEAVTGVRALPSARVQLFFWSLEIQHLERIFL